MTTDPPPGNRPAPTPERPFDARRLRRRRARLGARAPGFLEGLAAEALHDRLAPVSRAFARGLVLGPADAFLAARPANTQSCLWTRMDSLPPTDGPAIAGDPEWLPFGEGVFDLVVSPLALHWVNDLPGALAQITRAMKPDGLFLAGLLGGDTLHELRSVLLEAEAELTGGAGLRVAPMAALVDCAGLLQRAGLALPVADRERFTASYEHPLALLKDLQAMGETGGLGGARPALPRAVLAHAFALYTERFSRADGRVLATFDMHFLMGWKPHASQPKPLRPGSATTRLADALGTTERPAGDKAGT